MLTKFQQRLTPNRGFSKMWTISKSTRLQNMKNSIREFCKLNSMLIKSNSLLRKVGQPPRSKHGQLSLVSIFVTCVLQFLFVGNAVGLSFSETVDDYCEIVNQASGVHIQLPAANAQSELPLIYTLEPELPDGWNFNSDTRVISGHVNQVFGPVTYTYTAGQVDSPPDSPSIALPSVVSTLSFDITVAENISISSHIGDQYWYVNEEESITLPLASGGCGPLEYNLRVVIGDTLEQILLPSGWEFDESVRTLSGTPTEAIGQIDISYEVTDPNANSMPTVSDVFTVFVADQLSFVNHVFNYVWQPINYVLQRNEPITLTLPEASGGHRPLYGHSIFPSLPNGVEFDESTLTISGTPTISQEMKPYTYTVFETGGRLNTAKFTIAVVDQVSFEDSISDLEWIKNEDIGTIELPEASGGQGELSYALEPALPSGVNFDESTRTISGTPTVSQEMTEYTYTASDGSSEEGGSASLEFAISVKDPVDPVSFEDSISDLEWIKNEDIGTIELPEASGGQGELSYAIEPALPSGVNFNEATRTLSGTPQELQASTSYTYAVVDASGRSSTATFTIAVVDPVSFKDSISEQRWLLNEEIDSIDLPEASGGQGPFSYAIEPALPSGVNFNEATRTLSGTPQELQASTSYTYTVVDASGRSSTATFTIAVTESQQIKEQQIKQQTQELVENIAVDVATKVASNIAATIGSRFGAIPGSSINVGGQAINLTNSSDYSNLLETPSSTIHVWSDPEDQRAYQRSLGLDTVLNSSSFQMTLGATDGGSSVSAGGPDIAIWGRGDLQSFSSDPAMGAKYDSDQRVGYLGVDFRMPNNNVFGIMASATSSETEWVLSEDADEGQLKMSLRGLYPYLHYPLDDRSQFHSMVGAARGEIEISSENTETKSSDVSMTLAVAGARRNLEPLGNINLSVFGSLGFIQFDTEEGLVDVAGIAIDSSMLRFGTEASHKNQLADGGYLTNFVEVAGRWNSQDEETGLEVTPGLVFQGEGGRFGLDIRGRVLLLSSADDYEELGLTLTASLEPKTGGDGLSLAVSPRWGADTNPDNSFMQYHELSPIWSTEQRAASDNSRSLSLDVQIGYGVRTGPALVTPFSELWVSGDENRELRMGVRFNQKYSDPNALTLEFVTERRESLFKDADHRVGISGRLRF